MTIQKFNQNNKPLNQLKKVWERQKKQKKIKKVRKLLILQEEGIGSKIGPHLCSINSRA